MAVDAEQFQHALQNLLDNALAHTPQGGRITLAAEPADGKVVFSVADTGSGIPAEYLPLIFEKYFRVPGDTAPGGSGLGLAIVREIVTAHGGTVECESQPGRADRLPHDAAAVARGFEDSGRIEGLQCGTARDPSRPIDEIDAMLTRRLRDQI